MLLGCRMMSFSLISAQIHIRKLMHAQALERRKQRGAPAVPPRDQPHRLYSAANAQLAIARAQVTSATLEVARTFPPWLSPSPLGQLVPNF